MAEDFKKYLAIEILSEQRTVSYRTVSRALKVHVHAAKCMLYEFYEFQQGKKPGSIHATYLLSGVKKKPTATTNGHKDGYAEDEHIPSSPPPFTSSMLEPSQQSSQADDEGEAKQVPVRTITLVREEALETMKKQYETIASIHIYSLSPTRIADLVTLTDVGRGIFSDSFVKEDPLQHYKTYGIIQNPDVRQRKGKRPNIASGPAPKFQPVKEESKKVAAVQTKPSTKTPAPAKTEDQPSRPSSRDSTSTNPTAKPKQPTLKRDASDLFKAFAKQSQNKPKVAAATTTSTEDVTMKDSPASEDNEGESSDEALFLDSNTRKPATGSKKRPSDAKKEKEERTAKLRKLMDSDDEAEPAVPNVEKASGLDDDEPVVAKKGTDANVESKDDDEGEDVAWSASEGEGDGEEQTKKPATAAKTEDSQDSQPARRRGKRKVMKKRTVKDEDGYLVTKEEAAWESFSEDEAADAGAATSKKVGGFAGAKVQSQTQTQSQGQTQTQGKGGGGAKKKAGPGGGGNIMSFFGKKNA